MYDKGNNLRIEVTINNPKDFKVMKEKEVIVEHQKLETIKQWVPMGKSITNLYRYVEISKSITKRYMDALPEIDTDTIHVNELKEISSKKEIVTFLINTNQDFKKTYECYQGIINSINDKDFTKFKNIIYNQDKYLPDKMKKALKLFRDNIKYIENSFRYDINNGVIEGTNNLIKSLKRIAFGYKKHSHYINRIFLIKGLIKG